MSKAQIKETFQHSPLLPAIRRALGKQESVESVNPKKAALALAVAHKLEGEELDTFLKGRGLTAHQRMDVRRQMGDDLRRIYQRRFDTWGRMQQNGLRRLFLELVEVRNDGKLTTMDIRAIFETARKQVHSLYTVLNEQEARLKLPPQT